LCHFPCLFIINTNDLLVGKNEITFFQKANNFMGHFLAEGQGLWADSGWFGGGTIPN